jgi:hypothetical protein
METSLLDMTSWSEVEARLGGAAALSASAREHKALCRGRGVPDGSTLLRLALMHGPGHGGSLRTLAALASAEGIAEVSDVALMKRLKAAADWLEALCRSVFSRLAETLAPGTPADAIRIIDASRIAAPGGRAWRLHMCYAPRQGRMVDATITPLTQGERLDRMAVQPGEIRLGDRGYPQPDGLRAMVDGGANVLVRLTWNSLRLVDPDGGVLDWRRVFKDAAVHGTLDLAVHVVKPRGEYQPLPMRLILIRKPPAAAARARVQARRASRKDQRRRTDPRTLAAADYVMLLTSLPAKDYPLAQIGSLYRLRWQVELVFKRLKSLLKMGQLRARDPALTRVWLYAHLLFALLIEEARADLDAMPP